MNVDNRELHRQFTEEVFNHGDVGAIERLVAPELVDHSAPPGAPSGRDGLSAYIQQLHAAFPDVHFSIEDEIAEGDEVVVRTTMRGTHRGDFFGVPPTNRRVEVMTIDIVRMERGQIAEHWGLLDQASLMNQLGVSG